ncbi:hypothetical protein BVRB_6g141540 [Beta vulgaris subsp. vulgaris]|nr:hypothetical protein BVRB_6g141540 [Beta vulgaris subsp. vulgaris]
MSLSDLFYCLSTNGDNTCISINLPAGYSISLKAFRESPTSQQPCCFPI